MYNVIDAEPTVTSIRRLQAYSVLMSLQHGVIEKKSGITYRTASVIWKIQFTTNLWHNIKCCSPDIRSLPSGLPSCSALLSDEFLPRDATQSAVLLWQVVCLSVCP